MKRLHLSHRWLGLLAGLFALELAVTGLLLNHADALRLAERPLRSPWLLRWYGLAPAQPGPAFRAGAHWLSEWDGRLYLDARPLPVSLRGPLRGAAAGAELLRVLTGDGLALVTPEGGLADVLPLPAGVRHPRLLPAAGGTILRDAARCWRLNATATGWRSIPCPAARPLSATPLPTALRRQLRHRAGPAVTLERLLLDLHSGRLWGRGGGWVTDLAALALAGLALTGLTLWWRRSRRRRR